MRLTTNFSSEITETSDERIRLPIKNSILRTIILQNEGEIKTFLHGCSRFSHVQLCDPRDWGPLGYSLNRVLQGRILEWLAIFFSGGSFQPLDQTHISCIAGGFFFFKKIILLIYLDCSRSLLLCRLFSSCGKWGYSLVVVPGLLTAVASLVAEHGTHLQLLWLLSSRAQDQ